jgi:hypothetical protein
VFLPKEIGLGIPLDRLTAGNAKPIHDTRVKPAILLFFQVATLGTDTHLRDFHAIQIVLMIDHRHLDRAPSPACK